MPTKLTSISFLAALLATSTGCSLVYGDDIDARQCESNADCEAAATALGDPLVCLAHICQRQTCTTNAECPAQAICSNTVCVKGDAGPVQMACTQDSECGAGKRCGFDNVCYEKWGCLENDRDWTPNASATYSSVVRDFYDSSLIAGTITARACRPTEPTCNSPFVRPEQTQVDQQAKTFAVPFATLPSSGFIGSINVNVGADSADAGTQAFMPGYIHFTQENPLVSDLVPQTDILLVRPSIVSVLAASWDEPVDVTKAILVLQAHDCGGRKAPGMSIAPLTTVDGYFFVPIAGKTLPVPGETRTADDGAALAFNLPEKSLVFVLRDEDAGRVLSDTISMSIRAGAINYFAYYPRRSAVEKWMAHQKTLAVP